jgi:hypothetical protein
MVAQPVALYPVHGAATGANDFQSLGHLFLSPNPGIIFPDKPGMIRIPAILG